MANSLKYIKFDSEKKGISQGSEVLNDQNISFRFNFSSSGTNFSSFGTNFSSFGTNFSSFGTNFSSSGINFSSFGTNFSSFGTNFSSFGINCLVSHSQNFLFNNPIIINNILT